MVLKQCDKFLETKRPNSNGGEHFLKNRRQFLSFLTISNILGDFDFSVNDLVQLDAAVVSFDEFEKCWPLVKKYVPFNHSKAKIGGKGFLALCLELNDDGKIKGYERIAKGRGTIPNNLNAQKSYNKPEYHITDQFIEQVNLLLPSQPWKPGTHKEVASKLQCPVKKIYLAINKLVDLERRFRQKDGIIYDTDGNIIEIDIERVDKNTLKLKD